ncbi:alpha/beta hydrolase [Bacteriovoracales bacterium]|nr:alpha/beta hydrolase [Bacteriovoracales bacterium]
MTLEKRIDPQSNRPLKALKKTYPRGLNGILDIKERREALLEKVQKMKAIFPPSSNVLYEDYLVRVREGEKLKIRSYRPKDKEGLLPCLYYIHGGGMIMGSVENDDYNASMLSEELGAVIVSVDYRLAPEDVYPAQLNDCYDGLVWLESQKEMLKINASKIALYGQSAGGGLVIATSMKVRDNGGPSICFQMPVYPMIDDRHETPSSHEITDIGIWDRDGSIEAWKWYLGGKEADHYAAPSRATSLKDLPPTFIDVGELDLFRDENIIFAQRLLQAGVTTEFHLYPGAYHASENMAPGAALSKVIWSNRINALRKAFKDS